MFANSLIDRLIGLERYETISTGISSGAIKAGTPEGRKILKNFTPCFAAPTTVIPMKTSIASVNVTARWLVIVKEYGKRPMRFASKMKINKENIYGTNCTPSEPACSPTSFETKLKSDSHKDCIAPGINFLFLEPKCKNKHASNVIANIQAEAFVKEKSNPPRDSFIIGCISNWCNGSSIITKSSNEPRFDAVDQA
jgi:hypothetical protein